MGRAGPGHNVRIGPEAAQVDRRNAGARQLQQRSVEPLLLVDHPVGIEKADPHPDQVVRENAILLVDDRRGDKPLPLDAVLGGPRRPLPLGHVGVVRVRQQLVQEAVLALDLLTRPALDNGAHGRADP